MPAAEGGEHERQGEEFARSSAVTPNREEEQEDGRSS